MSSSTGSTALVKGMGSSSPVESQLTLAIVDFKKALTADQQKKLEKLKQVPDADSVLIFTAELDSRVQTTRKSVAGKLYPALASIRDFCAIVDTFVSSNPEIAALVWGSLRLTIFMFAASASQITALTDLFKFFQDASPRFAEYQALFPESTKLQEAVCNFHASIINCCSYLVRSIQLPWHAHLKQILWEAFTQEINNHKDEIQRRSGLVRYALEIAKMQADQQEQQFQAEERKNSTLFRKAVGASVDFQRMQLEKTERLNRAQLQSLLESLSDHNHILPWRQHRDKWQPGTLEWVFESHTFNNWMDGSAPPLLWCSGKIGSGKSILAAKVIDHLLTLKQRHHSDTLVTFFFICFDQSTSLDTETVLKSLIRQTLDEASLDADLVTQLENLRTDYFSDRKKLQDFLEQRVKQWNSFYIVVDGIDECNKSQRKSLLTALSTLCACHEGLRLLLAGRDSVSGNVRAAFTEVSSISPFKISDMTKFVDVSIQARLDDKDLVVGDEHLVEIIKTALVEGADGMFIWVVFQIEEICLQARDGDIRTTINDLPRDLKDVFYRILCRISSHDRGRLVRDALAWTAVAKEPLTKGQLRDALSIKIGQESLNSQQNINDIDGVILRCENLLQVDEEFGIVQFAHSSVLQFLQEKDLPFPLACYNIDMSEADHHAGEICVTYLNLNDFKTTLVRRKKPSEQISPKVLAQVALTTGGKSFIKGGEALQKLSRLGKSRSPGVAAAAYPIESLATFGRSDADASESLQERYPFLRYAGRWWILHSRDFNDVKSQMWHTWHQMLTQGHELAHTPWKSRTLQLFDLEILTWCSKMDHIAIIQCIATHPSLTEMDRIDFAHFSAGEGYLRLFKSLVSTLSDDSKLQLVQQYRVQESLDQDFSLLRYEIRGDGSFDSVSNRVSYRRTQKSRWVSRLLGGSTALHVAAWGGHSQLVDLLLSMNAIPHIDAIVELPKESILVDFRITALGLAVIGDHLDVVERLLHQPGHKINGRIIGDVRPRKRALFKKEHVEDTITIDPGFQHIPLQSGIYSGCSSEMVDLLSGKGHDYNDRSSPLGTPLQIAVIRGDLSIVASLLALGADVNEVQMNLGFEDNSSIGLTEQDIFLGDRPGYEGHTQLLRKNLRYKCDLFPTETPLELAARRGHARIVEMLLDSGASLNVDGGLVQQVQHEGHTEVLKILIRASKRHAAR